MADLRMTVLYECATCHFKDDVADRDDVPTCPMGGEPMVAVEYVPVTQLRGVVETLAEAVRAHTRAIHALAGNLDYPEVERHATGKRLAGLLAEARGQS
jgi:hypothetical protein